MANEVQAPPADPKNGDLGRHAHLLYHFCRLQLPVVVLAAPRCELHLQRTYEVYPPRRKAKRPGTSIWKTCIRSTGTSPPPAWKATVGPGSISFPPVPVAAIVCSWMPCAPRRPALSARRGTSGQRRH